MKPGDFVLNRRRGHRNARVGAITPIDGIVEEGVEAVVVLVRDGIVFMRMTLGTHHGQTEPSCGSRSYAVFHGLGPIFLVITAAFVISFCIAIEASGNFLSESGVGEEIARELLDGELVERHV